MCGPIPEIGEGLDKGRTVRGKNHLLWRWVDRQVTGDPR